MDDLTSGVEALDDLLEGVRVGDNLVLQGGEDVPLPTFGEQFLASASGAGRRVVHVEVGESVGMRVHDGQDAIAVVDGNGWGR